MRLDEDPATKRECDDPPATEGFVFLDHVDLPSATRMTS